MNRIKKGVFHANLLYLIGLAGIIVMGVIMAIPLAFSAYNAPENLSIYGPLMAVFMVVAELLPLMLPVLIVRMVRARGHGLNAGEINPPMRGTFRPLALLAVPTAIVGYVFVMGLIGLWSLLLGKLGLGAAAGMAGPASLREWGIALFTVAIVPAIAEEFLFRGHILPAYERHFDRPWKAILLSGVIFGLMHGDITSMPAHLLLGVVMGYVVVATNSLWAGIAYHFTNNAMAISLPFVLQGLQDAGLALPRWLMEDGMGDAQTAFGSLALLAVGGVLLCAFLIPFALQRQKALAAQSPQEKDAPLQGFAIPQGNAPMPPAHSLHASYTNASNFRPAPPPSRTRIWWPLWAGLAIAGGLYILTTFSLFLTGLMGLR